MPEWKPEILRRLAPLKLAPTREAEIADELAQHLEDRYQELFASGQSEDAAFRTSLDELKGEDLLARSLKPVEKAFYREPIVPGKAGANFFEGILQDVRYALRMLRKSPGFTAVAVLTLALGIGANTAIFSMVDGLVFRPLPVERPGEVVFLTSARRGSGPGKAFSYPDFADIQKQTADIFSDVSAMGMFAMDGLSVDGNSQSMWPAYVTGNFFRLVGIKPALGRFILPSEGKVAGADPVLVLSYAYWKARFNDDPAIIGKKATVNGHPVTIVGVAPEGFHGLSSLMDFQGYMPLGMAATLKDAPANFLAARENAQLFGVVARLRPGVNLAEAQAALNVVAQRLSQQYAATDAKMSLHALHLGPTGLVLEPTNPEILSLVSALFLILAGSVLVLACMNIANLFLARAVAREREMAVRAALGATRARLVRHLFTESVVLALFGCAAGIILGLGGSRTFGSIPLHTSLPIVFDFHFDWRVFAYALGAATLTGVLVGIMPALRAARVDVNEILHEGGRTSTARGGRFRSALVATQVGGSLMLLIIAGLFVRSLEKVQHTNLGFDPNHVFNLTIDPHEAGYDEAQAREFFRTLLDRARSLPGVQSASVASDVPMETGGGSVAKLKIDGYQPPKGENLIAGYNAVSSGYFEAMRIPLLRGREIQDSDAQNSQRVAIIDQTMANRFWHGEDPIGRRFRTSDDPGHPIEVVGIARNAVELGIFEPDAPFFYVPLFQQYSPTVTLQARSTAAPQLMLDEMTGLVRSLEPSMPVFDVQPMTIALDTLNGFLMFQFAAVLAACLGILGLILAVVGVYGVISYAASQRTHEIGIRIALGAQRMDILQMVLRQGFVIVAVGVVVGILAAAGIARLVGSFLSGVSPLDPLTYLSASLLLAGIALFASYVPARRSMKVDPMVALRYE
ncbi:MAG: ADOP family duplicated permease [Candidatus Acidiferrales bacterium]